MTFSVAARFDIFLYCSITRMYGVRQVCPWRYLFHSNWG